MKIPKPTFMEITKEQFQNAIAYFAGTKIESFDFYKFEDLAGINNHDEGLKLYTYIKKEIQE